MATFKGRIITRPYRFKDPIYYKGYHTGIDLGFSLREKVTSYTDGVIIENAWHNDFGWYVIVRAPDATTHHYFHFEIRSNLGIGTRVKIGTVLGLAGDTGLAFGVHLHYEVRRNNVDIDPIGYHKDKESLMLSKTYIQSLIKKYLGQAELDRVNKENPGAYDWWKNHSKSFYEWFIKRQHAFSANNKIEAFKAAAQDVLNIK